MSPCTTLAPLGAWAETPWRLIVYAETFAPLGRFATRIPTFVVLPTTRFVIVWITLPLASRTTKTTASTMRGLTAWEKYAVALALSTTTRAGSGGNAEGSGPTRMENGPPIGDVIPATVVSVAVTVQVPFAIVGSAQPLVVADAT